ncbi:MAG: 50S ribosomal protein L29 [Legionellaceae bacterium]|nr:50S ribosomal protein L29 [Legionellaceae bacterium]
MNKINELKKMTQEELQSELMSLRKEQFNLRMKKANGALDKTHVIRVVRKAIARVKTIMTEKVGE